MYVVFFSDNILFFATKVHFRKIIQKHTDGKFTSCENYWAFLVIIILICLHQKILLK